MVTDADLARHLDLARRVAVGYKRRLGDRAELDDLIGDANVGLLHGLRTWDPARGDLRPHLAVCAAREIVDAFRRSHGRHGQRQIQTVSLDQPLTDGDAITLADTVGDPRADIEVHVEARLALAEMAKLPLPLREITVRRAFGETQPEIGARLGVTASRVAQLEQRARHTPRPRRRELTVAEMLVLEHAAQGAGAPEAAARLGKGVETVRSQRRAVIRKLGARDMTHAVFLACRQGLLDQLAA